jgi:hypothetical protein
MNKEIDKTGTDLSLELLTSIKKTNEINEIKSHVLFDEPIRLLEKKVRERNLFHNPDQKIEVPGFLIPKGTIYPEFVLQNFPFNTIRDSINHTELLLPDEVKGQPVVLTPYVYDHFDYFKFSHNNSWNMLHFPTKEEALYHALYLWGIDFGINFYLPLRSSCFFFKDDEIGGIGYWQIEKIYQDNHTTFSSLGLWKLEHSSGPFINNSQLFLVNKKVQPTDLFLRKISQEH